MGEVTPLMSGMADEQPENAAAYADALRLADALERADAGRTVDIDAREDPALAGLLATAQEIRGPIADATETQAFRSFHHRSRAAILHALEAPPVETQRTAGPATVTAFRSRASRLWFGLAGTAAAAAIGLSVFSSTGANQTPAENLTVASTTDELDRISVALATIQQHRERGETVPAPVLRDVVESSARMSNLIEQRPDVVSREAVTAYAQTVQAGAQVLQTATAGPGAEGALAAAQRAAKDGAVVATRFLATQPTATPAATSTATPTSTPTATATPTSTSTPTVTPTATVTPTGTPTATPTATPTGTPTSTPTSTPTAPATPTATPDPEDDIVRP